MGNAATSNTGIVTGSGTIVTFGLRYIQKAAFLYVDYTPGSGATNVTMTIGHLNPKVHASNLYQETLFATANMAPITATFLASAGNGRYRFQLQPSNQETNLVVTFAFTGGSAQVIVCDMVPE